MKNYQGQHLLANFTPRITFTRSVLNIDNYASLLKAAQRIDYRYSHLVTSAKSARQLRTSLNRLSEELNRFRIEHKKAYMAPYEGFRQRVDILRAYLDSAAQHLTSIIQQDHDQRQKQMLNRLKKLTHKICQAVGIADIPVPPEARKMSLSKLKQSRIIMACAQQAKRDRDQQAVRPIGRHMVDIRTGQIEDSKYGQAVIRHFTFHGSLAQYRELKNLLKQAKLPITEDRSKPTDATTSRTNTTSPRH